MTATVIPFKRPAPPPPAPEAKCSFCQRPKSAVKKLVSNANETRHICDQCVGHATVRVTEEA